MLLNQYVEQAYNKLCRTLKLWQWHRPDRFSELAERLRGVLERISYSYNQIRNFSLLEFSDIPQEPLEIIWHELGCVKAVEVKNPGGYYLVMATTKPLMFLWGQTLAFDSIVRWYMPRFNIVGLRNDYWSFETWKKVLLEFQELLLKQPEVVQLFDKISRKEYGTDSIIPYGQFLDLYYWVKHR